MCAQFTMKKSIQELEKLLGLPINKQDEYSERALPHSKAVVVTEDGLTTMSFSLTPSWSPEPKVKYATYNARLETVDQKSTWRTPFLKHHCFVPMDAFIEPIYDGELGGNMVSFESESLMYAAAIYDTWVNKKTGEVLESFAIITSDPSPFVKSIGHDRQPVFLDLESAKHWNILKGSAKELKEFLVKHSLTPSLKALVDRPLKSAGKGSKDMNTAKTKKPKEPSQDPNLSLF